MKNLTDSHVNVIYAQVSYAYTNNNPIQQHNSINISTSNRYYQLHIAVGWELRRHDYKPTVVSS